MKIGVLFGLCVGLGASIISVQANDTPAQAAARVALGQKLNESDLVQTQPRPAANPLSTPTASAPSAPAANTPPTAVVVQPTVSAQDSTQSGFVQDSTPQSGSAQDSMQGESAQEDWTQSGSTQGLPEWTQNLYVNADAGIMFQQDAILYAPQSTPSTGTATFNPGVRGDIALGYNINKSWAAEFDTGVLWDSMDQFNGVSLSSSDVSFDTYTIPVLVNIIYKFPLKGPWSSYVKGGVGGAASLLSYKSYNAFAASQFNASDCSFVFAYQAEVGLKYALTQNASVGIAYKFFGTTDPSWQFTQTFGGIIPITTNYHFTERGVYTHSIVVSLTWIF